MINILLTNDDGVNAPGILELKKELDKIANVYVVAPLVERSASGHTISLHESLRVKTLGKNIYGCSGYPADCVVVGINQLLKDIEIDLVISGINRGGNMAQDIFYSGTVAGAREGLILNIPSVAISLAIKYNEFIEAEGSNNFYFSTAAKFMRKFIENDGVGEIQKDALLNINIPNIAYNAISDIKYTVPGFIEYPKNIECREDPRGRPYYWIGGRQGEFREIPDSDCMAILDRKISITDLKLSHPLTEKNNDRIDLFKRFL